MPVVGFPKPEVGSLDWSCGILVRGDISGPEIIKFVKEQLGPHSLRGCRPVRRNLFELSFKTDELADRFIEIGSPFDVGGKKIEQRRAGSVEKVVYVHGLPFPFPNEVLRHYMSEFGEISSIINEKWKDQEEETGVRLVKLVLRKDPPNFLRMGDFLARLSYAGLKRVCRKCGNEGHTSESCDILRCFNCSGEGHTSNVCPLPCHLCQKPGHSFLACSRKTFARVLAGMGGMEVTGSAASTEVDASETPAAMQVEKAVEEVAAASSVVASKAVLAKPIVAETVPVGKEDSLPEMVSPPSKKARSITQDLMDSGYVSPKRLFGDSSVIIQLTKGKKFEVDLKEVFSLIEVQTIQLRQKKAENWVSVGYWKDDRQRLFLRPHEKEVMEAFITEHTK